MSTTESIREPVVLTEPAAIERPGPQRRGRVLLQAFLVLVALGWLAPLLWAIYTSLRPYSDTAERGYFSLPGTLSLENYTTAWQNADLPHFYLNTLLITIPALILILLFASFVAFGVSKFSWRFNLGLLMLFTAGNLLPQQVIEQLHEDASEGLTEAALVDGATVWRIYWNVVMPLTRPVVAALATLEFTWIYNDFLWALVLIQTGDKRPITTALLSLRGVYFTDYNLLAAGSVLVAIPTLIVYIALQRQFIGGLALGATKG